MPPDKTAAEDAFFSSLRANDAEYPILNLEQGHSVPGCGRMIFYVADVDAFWEYLRGKGFNPESPRDASWGERYFHMADQDGHELLFARRLWQPSKKHERRGRRRSAGLHSDPGRPVDSHTHWLALF